MNGCTQCSEMHCIETVLKTTQEESQKYVQIFLDLGQRILCSKFVVLSVIVVTLYKIFILFFYCLPSLLHIRNGLRNKSRNTFDIPER